MEQEQKQRGLTFFSLTNERVVDLLSYAKYLYYIGIIETILYSLSIVGLPLIGFTIMATSFNQNPSHRSCRDRIYRILLPPSTFVGAI